MSNEGVEFLDENESRSSQRIDYNIVLMEQITKVRLSGSVEFRVGYWEHRQKVISGSLVTEKVYVLDTRQIYIGSITQLYDLLIPFFDDEFNKKDKDIQEGIKKLRKERTQNKKDLKRGEFNVRYYSRLLQIKRKQYKQLIILLSRMGALGIKKSKEVY